MAALVGARKFWKWIELTRSNTEGRIGIMGLDRAGETVLGNAGKEKAPELDDRG